MFGWLRRLLWRLNLVGGSTPVVARASATAPPAEPAPAIVSLAGRVGTAPKTGPGTAPGEGPGTAPKTGPGTAPGEGPGTAGGGALAA